MPPQFRKSAIFVLFFLFSWQFLDEFGRVGRNWGSSWGRWRSRTPRLTWPSSTTSSSWTTGATSGATCRVRWWSMSLGIRSRYQLNIPSSKALNLHTRCQVGPTPWWPGPPPWCPWWGRCPQPRRGPPPTSGGLSPVSLNWTRRIQAR